jgi:hypothetical protein
MKINARDGIRTSYSTNQADLEHMAHGIGNKIHLNKIYFIFNPALSCILILISVRRLRIINMPQDETVLACQLLCL